MQVPSSPQSASDFASCVVSWLADNDVFPVFLSGRPAETDDVPELSGIATGGAGSILDDIDVDLPSESGFVSGPTGARLNRAGERDLDSVGLVVESDPNFPDPEAARVLLQDGIEPIADLDVNVDQLVEHAEEIRQQKQQLAAQMQEAGDEESSQAKPLRMYQ